MKVCCFIDSLGSGGAQRQMVNMAIGLQMRNHQIAFITYHEDAFFQDKLSRNGIKNITIKSNYAADQVIKVWRMFVKEKPDVVISFLTSPTE